MQNNSKKVLLVFFLLAFFIGGCSTKSKYAFLDNNHKIVDTSLQQLSKRHLEYWNLYAQKRFSKTYLYEMPHQRFLHPLSWYVNFNSRYAENNTTYIQKEIIRLNPHEAIVKTKKITPFKSMMFNDKWYLIDHIWYHQMKTSILPLPFTMD